MLQLSRRQLLRATVMGGATLALASCSTAPVEEIDTSGPPRKGGTLRIGLVGGSSTDTIDAHVPTSTSDAARVINLYDALARRDDDYNLEYLLAEAIEPNDNATEWTITLREGVQFSDGRPVRPEDVMFSYNRIRDPEDPKSGAASIAHLADMEVLDERRLLLRLSEPDAALVDSLAEYQMGIVPEDYDPKHPIGAGAFKLKDFTAGQSTTLERNENYWAGPAHLDKVRIIDFQEEDAMLNALLSSQVDAIGSLNHALARVIESDPRLDTLVSETGMWLPLTMRVDVEPFDDLRVRQAMRLAVNRQQMVDQVYSGEGQLGNDMFARYDDAYPAAFPQREQDVEKAKALLAEAGYPDGIEVDLVTSEIQSGAVRAAQVFAEQASQAGIRVNIKQVDASTFYASGNYLEYPFAQSFWYTRNFLQQVNQCATADSPFNETHWVREDFTDRVYEARAIVDKQQREARIRELQQELYDEGGYIIWGFANQIDAYHNYIVGLTPHPSGVPLSHANFHQIWIAEA
ncbi:ABC transporter substrate-binding protein [Corynebacterium sp. HMSC074A01]|uniref:ABC transporter substrate-binding protein n=1 Tax=Corynebacterium sp. HMSC074A01 TaxID=1715030 RepID=UPI0008A2824A|nr:ABC transporter substrate-binding protein [Corynebacterium sp. HMSC074A01]OHF36080.1 peptide ABC transporter substrate-binding protein [Corynebacterium sp. HMSC074A01]